MKNKENKMEIIKKMGVNVLSIEAAWVVANYTKDGNKNIYTYDKSKNMKCTNYPKKAKKVISEKVKFEYNEKTKIDRIVELKRYKGTIPYSMEIIKLYELAKKEFWEDIRWKKNDKKNKDTNEVFTNLIIDVKFNSCLKDKYFTVVQEENEFKIDIIDEKIMDTKEIRTELYQNGFYMDGYRYVNYKRSGSKSRNGECLFIREDYYDLMMKWTWMDKTIGLDMEIDIASKRAYESLTLSSIEDILTFDNPAEQILLIDDYEDIEFNVDCLAIKEDKETNLAYVSEEKIKKSNSIWDGQGLLDSSFFMDTTVENEYQKGFKLLRNKFLKSAAFNTNIQKFFTDKNITEVTDMFGRKLDAKKIKYITTPNSVKYLKFSFLFDSNKECYEYWLENIDKNFGVVKSEKASYYNSYNFLSYQMINSLDLNKEKMLEIMKDEINYIKKIKNTTIDKKNDEFKECEVETEIRKTKNRTTKTKVWGDKYFLNHISVNRDNTTKNFMTDLASWNKDFVRTSMFKDFRKDTINDYVSNIRLGHVKINNTDYSVICSNPYEMLLASIGQFNGELTLKKNEIYSKSYKNNEEIAAFRNPNIYGGNTLSFTNKRNIDVLDNYFNFTNNIVVVNTADNDAPDRGQGFDMDSDTLLLTNNKTIVAKVKENAEFKTPISFISSSKENRVNNQKNMAEVDVLISKNLIGEIVNQSQILVSYYNHYRNTKTLDEKTMKALEHQIAILSICSGIEIDKAKKLVSLDNGKVLRNAREFSNKLRIEKNEGNKNKKERPLFMQYTAKKNEESYIYTKMQTSMDILEEVVDELKRGRRSTKIDIFEVLDYRKDKLAAEVNKGNRSKRAEFIKKVVANENKIIAKRVEFKDAMDDKKISIYKEIINLKNELKNDIRDLNLNKYTILSVINLIANTDKKINGLECKIKKEEAKSKKDNDKIKKFKESLAELQEIEAKKFRISMITTLYNIYPDLFYDIFKSNADNTILVKSEEDKIDIWGDKFEAIKGAEISKHLI